MRYKLLEMLISRISLKTDTAPLPGMGFAGGIRITGLLSRPLCAVESEASCSVRILLKYTFLHFTLM